jgi:hypothetical protein
MLWVINKMAKVYYEKLSNLLKELDIKNEVKKPIAVKHFFNGAALYTNQRICASWSPVGLSFKLPEQEVDKLIKSGKAIPLKYFPKGYIKKGYALFENPDNVKSKKWKKYLITSIQQI